MSELHIRFDAHVIDFLHSTWLRRGIIALLVALLGLLVWSLVPSKTRLTASTSPAASIPSRTSIGASVEKIAASHLFGHGADMGMDTGPAVVAASITVQGLFYSDDKDLAWAILEVNGKSGVYKTGDTLPDGEHLATVGVDAVQIATGTGLRVVEMAQTFGPASGIQLDGVPNLYARQDSFPGQAKLPTAAPPVQQMRTVSLPQGNDPIEQMRALREQLIGH